MKHTDLTIFTSNENKLKEFRRILPNLKNSKGQDLKEVDGTSMDVIIHKSKDSGPMTIVDDTILEIDGREIVSIRWDLETLESLKGKSVKWITNIGVNDGEKIFVYKGVSQGIVSSFKGGQGFAFDPYIIPIELHSRFEDVELPLKNFTFAQLEEKGLKDLFSARTRALLNLKENISYYDIPISHITEWTGSYQND